MLIISVSARASASHKDGRATLLASSSRAGPLRPRALLGSEVVVRGGRSKEREGARALYMGARPGRSPGDLVSCGGLRRLLTFVLLLCACLLVAMAATDGATFGSNNAAAMAMATGSPARRPGGADAFRSSKRRIPKGPDPIHNRYCLSTDGCMHAVVVLVCLHFGIFLLLH